MQLKMTVARLLPPLRRASAAPPKDTGLPPTASAEDAASTVRATPAPAAAAFAGDLADKGVGVVTAVASAATTSAATETKQPLREALAGSAASSSALPRLTVKLDSHRVGSGGSSSSGGGVTSISTKDLVTLREAASGMLLQLLPRSASLASFQLSSPLGQLLSRIRVSVGLSEQKAGTAARSGPSSLSSTSTTSSSAAVARGNGGSSRAVNQSLEEAMREYNEGVLQFHGLPRAATAAAAAATTAASPSKEALSAAAGSQKARLAANVVAKQQQVTRVRQDVLLKTQVDGRMRALIDSMRMKNVTSVSRAERVREFTKHLLAHPETRAIAFKEDVIPFLVSLVGSDAASSAGDRQLVGNVNEALALLGYTRPPRGRGIRILSIDGGGTRGLIAIETLKWIEATCERPIHELFDYVCGVSTGGLLAVLVGALRMPLAECERVYKECSERMFSSNAVLGASRLLLKYAYYDTKVWEEILKTEIGAERTMLSTARDASCPKIAVVSCLTSQKCLKNFLFRNYNLHGNVASHYMGTVNSRIWEAIRASSAAPGYFEEFKHGDYLHEDGGVLNNNPTAIAIHEAKHLWPGEALQCVVSLGNGRYEPSMDLVLPTGSSLMAKVTAIVQSATNTEGVHTVLVDLLDPAAYYRFNPYMSEDFGLDEIRPEKVRQMQFDADLYLRKNASKLRRVGARLQLQRRPHRLAQDWLRERSLVLGASLPSSLLGTVLRLRGRTAGGGGRVVADQVSS